MINHRTYIIFILVLSVLIGFACGWYLSTRSNETRLERVVALSWGDGKYGPAFYGAHVYLKPIESGYSVRARIYIGRGNNYFHDCGELGRAKTDAEAVSTWGNIEWKADGLHIGTGPDHFFLPQSKVESHR
jgi:hypothetical protein